MNAQEKSINVLLQLKVPLDIVAKFETRKEVYIFESDGSIVPVGDNKAVYEKLQELQRKHAGCFYAILHEQTLIGELYDFLYFSEYPEDEPLMFGLYAVPAGKPVWHVYSYVWNVTTPPYSEFGSILIQTDNGCLKHVL